MEDAPRPPPSQILEIAATIAGTVGRCGGEKHGGSALRGRGRGRLSITRDFGVEFGGGGGRGGEGMRGGREGCSSSRWMYEQVIP